jgi:hypothetical protein
VNDAYVHYHHARFEGIGNQTLLRSKAQPFGQKNSKPG